jgi:BirA family transcriptional regulator, biotin operon repressor / biotin---[acetyl-CoA-carboxylase] ligase
MDLLTLKSGLAGLPIEEIYYHPSTGSTNDDALDWSAQGARDGCLVFADQQTKGRGRQGRKWISRAEAGLAFSLIFRPTQDEISHLSLFSPFGAIAVCQAIEKFQPIATQVKWPNDVLVNRKKVAGVLAETNWMNGRVAALVLGIGVNLAPSSIPEKMELRYPATCLENECGQPIDRLTFLRSVCEALFTLRPMIGSSQFMHQWDERLAFKNELVCVETAEDERRVGRLAGIDLQGNLLLTIKGGEQISFRMGEVSLMPAK